MSEQEIRAKFKLLADEWARHCQKWINSSNPDDYLKCPAYRGLVALGKPAVPLIMEIYGLENEETDPRSWEYALDEITGLRFIENPDDFEPEKVRRRYLAWWEKEKENYNKAAPARNQGPGDRAGPASAP